MKSIVIAMDSFKGTMSAQEVCAIVEKAAKDCRPDTPVKSLPMADGGEGLVEAALSIMGGKREKAIVSGPYGEKMQIEYGVLSKGTAVMEMASFAVLILVGDNKNPMITTTKGVGELILHASGAGHSEILMGIGGSATNDCGIGMAHALGYIFYDEGGNEVEPLAKNMGKVFSIKKPSILPKVNITVACDVDNPLYGPKGATYTFGMQKGAAGDTLALLDEGLINMARVIKKDLGIDVSTIPGSGAAGGLGAGLVAFLGARLMPGIEILLNEAGFDDIIDDAKFVITGEGRIDWQSAYGKVPCGVALRAQKKGIPCIALCGAIGEGVEKVYEKGITAVFSSIKTVADFETIKKTCRDDLYQLAFSIMRILP